MQEPNSWIEIVGEIAHELKTPLTSAKGFLDLLRNGPDPLTQRQERFGDRALEALDRMERLVTRLLEIAWIDQDRPLEPEVIDLGAAIERAAASLSDYADRHGVTLQVDIAPQLGTIQADERRIDQVLVNLLSNAIKYNRAGGSVWVRAQGTTDSVEVSVRDSGHGIAAEDLPHIFDRFFRAQTAAQQKIEGTGLGLSIVKALIEKHGGRIWVESTLGAGSTFTFMLPRAFRLSEGHDSEREAISLPDERAESVDLIPTENSNEELDAVDDNIQEPPQTYLDRDEPDVAEQQ